MLEIHVGIYTTMVVYNSDHRSVEVITLLRFFLICDIRVTTFYVCVCVCVCLSVCLSDIPLTWLLDTPKPWNRFLKFMLFIVFPLVYINSNCEFFHFSFFVSIIIYKCFIYLQDIIRLVVGRLAAGDRFFGKCFALKLVHIKSQECYWLHNNLTMYQVKQKYEAPRPPEEWRYVMYHV